MLDERDVEFHRINRTRRIRRMRFCRDKRVLNALENSANKPCNVLVGVLQPGLGCLELKYGIYQQTLFRRYLYSFLFLVGKKKFWSDLSFSTVEEHQLNLKNQIFFFLFLTLRTINLFHLTCILIFFIIFSIGCSARLLSDRWR